MNRIEERRTAIHNIVLQIVASQIEKGEVDPDDDVQLRDATKEAVRTARETYDAVQDFLS
jgi:hypothetical protein